MTDDAGILGDDGAFARVVDGYRGELRIHCYRMLGSFTDAEDHVQETMLRAWRSRESFEGRATLRAWLYRIATNVCLDTLRTHPERVVLVGDVGDPVPSEIPWLQPYPDRLLDGWAPSAEEPSALVVARETIELAYLVAIQLLPPNQRAVLILRDVLDFSAAETANLLGTSVASVTSALQRARTTLKQHGPDLEQHGPVETTVRAPAVEPSAQERALLQRYMDAHAQADSGAIVAMMREDVRFTMPPQPTRYEGRTALAGFFAEAFGPQAVGEFRLVATRANRHPAAANYIRVPGDSRFRAMSLDVLRFEGGELAEITTFDTTLFPAFGLPEVLPETGHPETETPATD